MVRPGAPTGCSAGLEVAVVGLQTVHREQGLRGHAEADVQVTLGDQLMRQGNTKEAVVAYRRCAELDPAYPRCQLKLYQAYGKLDRPREAAAAINSYMRLSGPGATGP